jgi:replicative DNA helicase
MTDINTNCTKIKVSGFKGAKNTNPEENFFIDDILAGIKDGRCKEKVDHLRSIKDKNAYAEAKMNLPAVTFSGTFSKRNKDSLIKHSGFICLDIDKLDDVEAVKASIKADRFVYAMFTSVSGKGLAVIVRIESDRERHFPAFLKLKDYFLMIYELEVDKSCSDISRLRFLSYDPDLYLNSNAEVFKVSASPPVSKKVTDEANRNEKGWFADAMKGVGEGNRDAMGAKLAGYLINKHIPEDVNAVLLAWNQQNEPPLSEEQVNKIVKSIARYKEDDDWQTPIPFDDYSRLPDFPTEVLPSIGREMVETVSRVNQVDKGLPGSMYLSILSTSLSKKVLVDLGTHKEPVNIYTCPILDPGERKTTTMNLMMNPVYEYQKKKAREIRGDDEEPPVYVVDDITSEALFKLMSENNERMSVISAEGGIFAIMAGRYNSNGNGNIDVYLKGHAGDPCSTHRISRESQSMDSPCLTIILAVQRDVIKEIGSNRQFRGLGLLARFLYSNCKDRAGYRNRQTEEISDAIIQKYKSHVLGLMEMPLELHVIKLSQDAQQAWDTFYDEVESYMQTGGRLYEMKDWGSKLPGAVARISGLLHCAEHGKQSINKPISVGIVDDSVAIGRYYLEHSLSTFGLMGEEPQVEAAKKILEYLKHHKPDSFKGRDILRNKSAFKKMDEIIPGLNLLVERNYIRKMDRSTNGHGRPEAITYEVNPKPLM